MSLSGAAMPTFPSQAIPGQVALEAETCAFQNKANQVNERQLWLNITALSIGLVLVQDVSEILRTESFKFSSTQKKTRMPSIPLDHT